MKSDFDPRVISTTIVADVKNMGPSSSMMTTLVRVAPPDKKVIEITEVGVSVDTKKSSILSVRSDVKTSSWHDLFLIYDGNKAHPTPIIGKIISNYLYCSDYAKLYPQERGGVYNQDDVLNLWKALFLEINFPDILQKTREDDAAEAYHNYFIKMGADNAKIESYGADMMRFKNAARGSERVGDFVGSCLSVCSEGDIHFNKRDKLLGDDEIVITEGEKSDPYIGEFSRNSRYILTRNALYYFDRSDFFNSKTQLISNDIGVIKSLRFLFKNSEITSTGDIYKFEPLTYLQQKLITRLTGHNRVNIVDYCKKNYVQMCLCAPVMSAMGALECVGDVSLLLPIHLCKSSVYFQGNNGCYVSDYKTYWRSIHAPITACDYKYCESQMQFIANDCVINVGNIFCCQFWNNTIASIACAHAYCQSDSQRIYQAPIEVKEINLPLDFYFDTYSHNSSAWTRNVGSGVGNANVDNKYVLVPSLSVGGFFGGSIALNKSGLKERLGAQLNNLLRFLPDSSAKLIAAVVNLKKKLPGIDIKNVEHLVNLRKEIVYLVSHISGDSRRLSDCKLNLDFLGRYEIDAKIKLLTQTVVSPRMER